MGPLPGVQERDWGQSRRPETTPLNPRLGENLADFLDPSFIQCKSLNSMGKGKKPSLPRGSRYRSTASRGEGEAKSSAGWILHWYKTVICYHWGGGAHGKFYPTRAPHPTPPLRTQRHAHRRKSLGAIEGGSAGMLREPHFWSPGTQDMSKTKD